MPEGTSGSNPDKSATAGPQRGRKTPNPAISDEALAALERHYGSMNEEPARADTDSTSATGFAAMLAQGSVAGGSSGGSSGAMSESGGGQESNRRDGGEIPEAKIIAVRPDSASNDTPRPALRARWRSGWEERPCSVRACPGIDRGVAALHPAGDLAKRSADGSASHSHPQRGWRHRRWVQRRHRRRAMPMGWRSRLMMGCRWRPNRVAPR